ncbi:alpha/beta fold hydrolase [Loigolactobacillus backii]|uniref:Alpha/beta hydrolase n=1 Tax=Loigolactobacillus backii TaxID=375175 RepID=A0A192H3P3_9LACO|nr:alpha/beta hydrolase [Loigolactobacillus backii]ANK62873.1 alpha/beta hydrolase [Loigolactobacillus backii]ANK70119.1 alpha/beta hydrolase [Loigolactobacillus backii]MDA5387248.1 alpha/beta hydrolase [Loigolactobacillus backii]MDA5389785.1 alpha/beta hydrolase [Loigolactobacillus backii]PIO83475.1 alpha/beta hydrolase [Loigolactobacillus backii]
MSYFETNDNVKLYYSESGQGQNLLLVHGYGCSGKYFERNIPELGQHFHVITVDLRGHGNSNTVNSGARISRLATDIHELLTQLNLTNVTYLGWSMGCSVGWSYWDLFQNDRLSKFIFVDEPAWALSTKENPSGLLNYQATLDFCKSLFTNKEEALGSFIKGIVIDKTLNLTDLLAESNKGKADFIAPLFYNHMVNNWSDVIKTITIPSLVISGKKSFFNWKLVKQVSDELPKGQFESFANVGHMLFYEEADRFNKLVTNFVQA